ncbi:MAG: hypothetical protein MI741_01285 [Rhodospirillales bacterium]|nr:hypothetical protein [Rhodospirillales bacterium]
MGKNIQNGEMKFKTYDHGWQGTPLKYLATLIFLVALIGIVFEASGQTKQQQYEAARAELEKELLAGGDPIKQSNVLISYHKQLDEKFDYVLVDILSRNVNDVTPVGLMVLADRMTEMSPEHALFWYAVAIIRAQYDGRRCADETATQGASMLPMMSQRVRQLAAEQPELFAKQGKKAIGWGDLFSSRMDPSWICLHGIGSFSGESPRNFTDSSSWSELKWDLHVYFTEFFEEMGQPDVDPIAWADPRPVVTRIFDTEHFIDFGWLGAETLVFATEGNEGWRSFGKLMRWAPETKAKDIGAPSGLRWCVGGGSIVYEKSRKSEAKKELPDIGYVTLKGDVQTFGYIDGKKGIIWDRFAGPSQERVVGNGPFHVLSPFDCHLERPQELLSRFAETEQILGEFSVLPLRDGDGFLVTRFKEYRDAQDDERKIAYFSDQKADPLVFSFDPRGIEKYCIRYFEFAKAYFLSVCRPEWNHLREFKKQGCAPSWWFDPRTRNLEKSCTEINEIGDGYATISPVRDGLLRVVQSRKTARGRKPGGIYLYRENGGVSKIYEGRIRKHEVSPQGCLIAVLRDAIEDGKQAFRKKNLEVIDICSEG